MTRDYYYYYYSCLVNQGPPSSSVNHFFHTTSDMSANPVDDNWESSLLSSYSRVSNSRIIGTMTYEKVGIDNKAT